jgi:pimeloyl-ACP methyl ester carboxylesterase
VVAAAAALAGAWAVWRLAAVAAAEARSYRRAAARLRDVRARVAGLELRARVATGAAGGPPLLFVHGFGVSSAYWVPLAATLADTHPVYVIDLPGHGGAESAAEAPTVERLAEATVGWMDALGLRRAVLVANSMGCQTAAEVAVRHPRRVDALVLVGPTVDPTARVAWRQAARLAASAPFERLALDAIVVGDYVRAGPRLLVGELRAMLAHRIEDALRRVRVPTLVVRGAHDSIVPRRWAAEAARLARGAWVEIPGAGHAVHFDEPEAVADEVRRFVRRALPARRRRGLRTPASA